MLYEQAFDTGVTQMLKLIKKSLKKDKRKRPMCAHEETGVTVHNLVFVRIVIIIKLWIVFYQKRLFQKRPIPVFKGTHANHHVR